MREQMQIPNELVSSGGSCWCIYKSLNKCDNAIIIYLLLHLKHILSDFKSCLLTRKDHFNAAFAWSVVHIATARDLHNTTETNDGST